MVRFALTECHRDTILYDLILVAVLNEQQSSILAKIQKYTLP